MKQYSFLQEYLLLDDIMSLIHLFGTTKKRVKAILRKYPTKEEFIKGCDLLIQKNPGKSTDLMRLKSMVESCTSYHDYVCVIEDLCRTRVGLTLLSWIFNPFNFVVVAWKYFTADNADKQIVKRASML